MSRLNPAVHYFRLWNTDDPTDDAGRHKAIFIGTTKPVEDLQTMLARGEPWFEDAGG